MSSSANTIKVFSLLGPTASGKTNLALQLAEHLPIEIISMDSAMVYRHMNIGTGKPDSAILQRTPHHLIDIIEPDASYSAAKFRTDAVKLIHAIHARGKVVLIVGGTMLYFKALLMGLHDLPKANAAIRQKLAQQLKDKSLAYLYDQLKISDPPTAARLHVNDKQRILRALEVYQLTGKPLSEHLQQPISTLPFKFFHFALMPSVRLNLHQRIEKRFTEMLQLGFIDEVISLRKHYSLNLDHPAMRAVGYRQIWQYLDGQFDKVTMIARATAATRQLAKRQLTWLRHFDAITSLPMEAEDLRVQLLKRIEKVSG
ncbi:MAG: tRNA (adenosine(37)-N6)-dimethylallyltransferase MiaA [Pseudomonadota bacterium]